MAEYIERKAFVEAVKDIPMWGSVAAMFADGIPAADVAPVVRCKDCKHEFGGSCSICWFQKRKPDDFCSYGERKDGETDA